MFDGVATVFLPVSDVNRAVEWYHSVVGLRPTFRDDEHRAAGVDTGTAWLCLVESSAYAPLRFPDNDFRVDISFNLATRDIDRAHATLRERGAVVHEILDSFDGSFRCFTFDDPDGNRISVVESSGG